MNKDELLAVLTQAVKAGKLTHEEVLRALPPTTAAPLLAARHRLTISDILYYIGGAIVIIGVVVLISQNWAILNNLTRVLTTLGTALAAYVVGTLLSQRRQFTVLSYAFYLISAVVLPIGLYVTLHVNNVPFTLDTHTLIALLLFAVYFTSFLLHRNNLFLLFSILFASWFFFAFTSYLVGARPIFPAGDFIAYRFLAVGTGFVLLGYQLATLRYRTLTPVLYSVGLAISLGAALALGKWQPQQNIFWELIFPGLVFAVIFLSVQLKSKAFLVFGTIYLMAYILKITAEYFTHSLGWPLALVLAGLALMAVGYLMFYVNKKYISTPAPVIELAGPAGRN